MAKQRADKDLAQESLNAQSEVFECSPAVLAGDKGFMKAGNRSTSFQKKPAWCRSARKAGAPPKKTKEKARKSSRLASGSGLA